MQLRSCVYVLERTMQRLHRSLKSWHDCGGAALLSLAGVLAAGYITGELRRRGEVQYRQAEAGF